ncbi:flagellar hook-basal body complex protein FliE [Xanthomonas campestris pv. phormiicola]|nr:flagellar hook-basal body complex protein FliE [Xanthomonas campestris pv. phormiicola]
MPSLDVLSPLLQIKPANAGAVDIAADGDASAQGFSSLFQHALQRVDAQQRDAARQADAVDSGDSDDLIGAMLSSQQAGLSFSMLTQVRNKVMAGLDDLLKMNI